MSISGLNAANNHMVLMMQILMQGMRDQANMTQAILAVNVENSASGQKMATAQQIIDVYA